MINNRFYQPRIAAERVEDIDQVCNGFFRWTNFALFFEAVERWPEPIFLHPLVAKDP
jgi:hypothetical protein